MSVTAVTSCQCQMSLMITFILLFQQKLCILFREIMAFHNVVDAHIIRCINKCSHQLDSFCIFQNIICRPSYDHAGFFLSQLPDNLLLYMNGAVCQIRIFGKGTSHITLCTFTCDGSAFLYSVHNVCRDAYLFDNLIHKITIIKLNPQILCNLLTDGIALGSIFAANRNYQMFHALPSHTQIFIRFSNIRNPLICYVNRYFLMFGRSQVQKSYRAGTNDFLTFWP